MIEAAIAGLGAAIAQRALVAADIAAGRLEAPLGFRPDGAVFAVFTRAGGRRLGIGRLIAGLRREGGFAS